MVAILKGQISQSKKIGLLFSIAHSLRQNQEAMQRLDISEFIILSSAMFYRLLSEEPCSCVGGFFSDVKNILVKNINPKKRTYVILIVLQK